MGPIVLVFEVTRSVFVLLIVIVLNCIVLYLQDRYGILINLADSCYGVRGLISLIPSKYITENSKISNCLKFWFLITTSLEETI